MMSTLSRSDLISSLSAGVSPVKPGINIILEVMLWFISSWVYVISLSLYLGPLRPGAIASLATSPQFAFETLIGFLAGALFCLIAFRESIPGLHNKWLVYLSYFTAILWISSYVVGLSFPAIEPSMFGKRAHCVLEAYLYSTPPLIVGYLLIYRRFPLDSVRAGIFLGIYAGMLPALFMQISCMYDPRHILTHHIGPILVVVIAGAVLGLILKKQKTSVR